MTTTYNLQPRTVTLTNGRGEDLAVTIKTTIMAGEPGTVGRFLIRVVLADDVPADVTFEAGVRAVFGDGVPVNNWVADDRAVELTSGDLSRLGTYPLYLGRAGDFTKRGRFQLRSIPGIEGIGDARKKIRQTIRREQERA